jgi:2-iminobutanoate/2-iminopropanoate deaminase
MIVHGYRKVLIGVLQIALLLLCTLSSFGQSKISDKSMQKQIILTDSAPKPIGPYSQAVLAGNTLYVSGQIALNPATGLMEQSDIETETHQVMKNMIAILKQAGFDLSQVVKVTIFCTDLNNFAAINGVYGGYFKQDPPARETVQVSRLPKDARVEISVIAVK